VDGEVQIESVLSTYEPVLTLVDRAAAMERLQLPLLSLDGEEWPRFATWRSAGYLKTSRAKRRASLQDWDGAVRDLGDNLHLGRMLAEGDAELIRFLVASAIQSTTLTAIRCLAGDPTTPTEALRELLLLVQEPEDLCKVWSLVRRVEFATFSVPMLARIAEAPAQEVGINWWIGSDDDSGREKRAKTIRTLLAGNTHPFDLADTVRRLSETVRDEIDACTLPWAQARFSATKDAVKRTEAEEILDAVILDGYSPRDEVERQQIREALARAPNPVGRSWLRLQAGPSYVEIVFRQRAGWRATNVALLVESYRRQRGTLPASLTEVLPTSSPVLVDPYSGKSFRYSAERGILWSVGKNGRDDGGHPSSNCASSGDDPTDKQVDDIVWHLRS
jgi:hypothetical protein